MSVAVYGRASELGVQGGGEISKASLYLSKENCPVGHRPDLAAVEP